jgi:hypothetical protein
MGSTSSRFVPKVHPATRSIEPEDPFTLTATTVPGDRDIMIRAVVQEYAWLGWSADQILSLFRDPFFPVLHALWRAVGEAELRTRIAATIETFGVFRFQSSIVETPDDPERCLDLPFVSLESLTDRSHPREGGHHE